MTNTTTPKYISWYSCGASSAVAAKLALITYGKDNVRVIYQKTNSEHPDNTRFLADCEEWFGVTIEQHQSPDFKDIWDVFEKKRWLVGVGGARCTTELKRKLAENTINWGKDQETEIFGYTVDEGHRVRRFIENNSERKILPILVDRGLTKTDCLGMLEKAGIALPAMYLLGYQNNNCIGCVKGQGGYWNKIRVDFPDVFDRMAKVERELNAAINKDRRGGTRKRMFLDEMPTDFGRDVKEPAIECGILCSSEYDTIELVNL